MSFNNMQRNNRNISISALLDSLRNPNAIMFQQKNVFTNIPPQNECVCTSNFNNAILLLNCFN